MNVGVREALKVDKFDCFIFHDVDLLPENDKNIYFCDNHIRQLSSAIDEMRYQYVHLTARLFSPTCLLFILSPSFSLYLGHEIYRGIFHELDMKAYLTETRSHNLPQYIS